MTADEQINGVLEVIKHARDVTASGIPVRIVCDKFEEFPDHKTILEKLEWDHHVISIKKYPILNDVDYRVSVGFVDDDKLEKDSSYHIDILPKFDQYAESNGGLIVTKTVHATVAMSNNDILLLLSDGTQRPLKRVRTDSAPYNFMRYIIARPKRYVRRATIQKEVENCEKKDDMTELVRQCGFDSQLKDFFFPDTTKDKVHFLPDAVLPNTIVNNRKKS